MKLRVLISAVLVGGAFPVVSATAQEPVCPGVEAPEVAFDQPTYIDRQRAGGEPVSVVAQDGSIIVSAHAGTTHIYKDPAALPGVRDFAVGYFNQTLHWRSTDGGRTWEYIGLFGQREGPHTLTSTGFSDPDLTIDQGGRIYDVEIDLANVGVFSSVDDGQSFPFGNAFAAAGDRPWLTGQEADEVYLYVNQPKLLWRSTNGGLTFENRLPAPPTTGKLQVDPLNPNDGLIGSVGGDAIAISGDNGQTWTQHPGSGLSTGETIFPVLAADRAGNVYKTSVDGYGGPSDTNPNGTVEYNYFDRATQTWGTPIDIPIPAGDALWPWITAGDDGRVAFTWYQTLAGDPDTFYIYMAYTTNGRGTTVTCSDGSTAFVPPQFTVINASGRPIHKGDICLGGTGCNASTNFAAGDRRLGDFFTINHDLAGNLFIASADTMLTNPLGGPKPVGNPIFIRQVSGARLLAEPITPRETRCLWPLPSC